MRVLGGMAQNYNWLTLTSGSWRSFTAIDKGVRTLDDSEEIRIHPPNNIGELSAFGFFFSGGFWTAVGFKKIPHPGNVVDSDFELHKKRLLVKQYWKLTICTKSLYFSKVLFRL